MRSHFVNAENLIPRISSYKKNLKKDEHLNRKQKSKRRNKSCKLCDIRVHSIYKPDLYINRNIFFFHSWEYFITQIWFQQSWHFVFRSILRGSFSFGKSRRLQCWVIWSYNYRYVSLKNALPSHFVNSKNLS